MSILLLNWNKNRWYCVSLYLLLSQILHPCFLGWPYLWPGRERAFRHQASCSWWRPGLHHWSLSVLFTSTGCRLKIWPQALCVQLGCVPASWLSHKASAPTPGQGFLPISFKESLIESTQNSGCSFLCDWNVTTNAFFSFCFFDSKTVHLRFYSYIFNWISPLFFPTNLNLSK